MKLAIISTAAAFMTCASLAAQTPTPGSSVPGSTQSQTYPAPSSASRSMPGNDSISVTGCVEGSGTAFKLTKVADASKAGSGSASAGAPRAGATAPKDPEALLDEYALTADPSVNLSQHVNHKVTVTGTVSKTTAGASMSSPSGASASSSTSASGSSMGGRASSLNDATLKVTSLRMVSSSCQ